MKRSSSVKFPNSVQLFKFCLKVMAYKKGSKVRDQEVGAILNFNPSDCSHWKRGEKNVKSVFVLAKLSETLGVESSLIHDVASGAINLDEAFFEYIESNSIRQICDDAKNIETDELRQTVVSFVDTIHAESQFTTPPLYLPEVFRLFSFVSTQPVDMIDRLSRVLRVKAGRYGIQYKKGDLKPQTRMSIVKDFARVIFEVERARYPELGTASKDSIAYEELLFVANLLIPRNLLMNELTRLDARKNVVAELAALFWVPKSLICFQLQEMVKYSQIEMRMTANEVPSASANTHVEMSNI